MYGDDRMPFGGWGFRPRPGDADPYTDNPDYFTYRRWGREARDYRWWKMENLTEIMRMEWWIYWKDRHLAGSYRLPARMRRRAKAVKPPPAPPTLPVCNCPTSPAELEAIHGVRTCPHTMTMRQQHDAYYYMEGEQR